MNVPTSQDASYNVFSLLLLLRFLRSVEGSILPTLIDNTI